MPFSFFQGNPSVFVRAFVALFMIAFFLFQTFLPLVPTTAYGQEAHNTSLVEIETHSQESEVENNTEVEQLISTDLSTTTENEKVVIEESIEDSNADSSVETSIADDATDSTEVFVDPVVETEDPSVVESSQQEIISTLSQDDSSAEGAVEDDEEAVVITEEVIIDAPATVETSALTVDGDGKLVSEVAPGVTTNELGMTLAKVDLGVEDGTPLTTEQALSVLLDIATTEKDSDLAESVSDAAIAAVVEEVITAEDTIAAVDEDDLEEIVEETTQKKKSVLKKLGDLFTKEKDITLLTVEAKTPEGETVVIPQENLRFQTGSVVMVVEPLRSFTPGTYELTVTLHNPLTGKKEELTQDFAWGVLSMNFDKDTYAVGDVASVHVGILDEKGKPVCNADAELRIEGPKGTISTGDVTDTGNCTILEAGHIAPDYTSIVSFTDGAGTYAVTLTADNGNGEKSVKNVVTVYDAAAEPEVLISRISATRNYPKGTTPMTVKMTFTEDFTGKIVDVVPHDFWIEMEDDYYVADYETEDDVKYIVWDNIDAKAGDVMEVTYTYDAPDVSPEFYTLGPLSFVGLTGETLHTEARMWQIANDVPFDVTLTQSATQADVTYIDEAVFTVTFSEAINPATFVAGDITLSGTTGTVTAGPTEVAPNDGTTFEFTVTGMTSGDVVEASMAAGVVDNVAGTDSNNATSDIPTGSLGFWPLDEQSGVTAYDYSGNGYDGTNVGSPTQGVAAQVNTGYQMSLASNDDYVDFDAHIPNIEGLDEGSIAFWYNSVDAAGDRIVFMDDGGTNNMFVYVGDVTAGIANESIIFELERAGTERLVMYVPNGHAAYLDGAWHHFVIATGDGDNRIYVDGVRETVAFDVGTVATTEFSNMDNEGSLTARLGSNGAQILDEFGFWDHALSDAEVADLFAMDDARVRYEASFGVDTFIDQVLSQSDPTFTDSATFEVTFSEAIDPASFTASDISLAGTTGTVTSGPTEIAPNDGTTFVFTITGMTVGDTVTATLPAGVVHNAGITAANAASVAIDNQVTYSGPHACVVPNLHAEVLSTTEVNFSTPNGPSLADQDRYGFSMTNLGDLDGDGVADLAVGSFFDDNGGLNRGAVHIHFLNADSSIKSTVEINSATANGPTLTNEDNYGKSIQNIGDLDGDGVIDIAVGAHNDDNGGLNRGTVHIHYMNSDGSVKSTVEINSSTPNGPTLSNEDNYGYSITNLGDLDGDGVIDLLVGSERDDAGGADRGAVHIHYMNSDGSVKSTVEINDTTANGPVLEDNGYYGRSSVNLGDLDGDGVTDIAVGESPDDTGGTDRGAVHIHFLNANGSVKSTVEINDTTANGPILGDGYGYGDSFANLGDLDGDGVVDLVVGAPGAPTVGGAYISFLNTDGSVKATNEINSSTVNGPTDTDNYGIAMSDLGDLDGDGMPELAVGAYLDDSGGTNRGAFHIHNLDLVCSNFPPTGTFNAATQKTDGTGLVDLSVEIDDADDDDTRVKIEYETDSDGVCDGPWADATLAGPVAADFSDTGGVPDVNNANAYQVGSTATTRIITSSGSNSVDVDWASQTDLPTANGTQCLRLTANDDTDDQITPDTITLTVDNVAPATPAAAPDLQAASDTGASNTDDITADTTPTFDVTCTEAGATITLYIDGVPNGTHTCAGVGTEGVTVTTPLANGTYAVTYTETDAFGNESGISPSLSITIDSTVPAAPGTPDMTDATDTGSSNTDDITADTTPDFTGTCTDGDTITLYIDGAATTATTTCAGGAYTLTAPTALADGSYDITTTATNSFGSESAQSGILPITIDTIAPAAPGTPDMTDATDTGSSNTDDITGDNTPDFTGSCTDGDVITLYIDGIATTATTTCSGGAYTLTVPTALADGTYDITTTATDPAGNESAQSAALPITIDTTAPTITIDSADDDDSTEDDTPTVRGTSNSPGATVVVTGPDGETCTTTVQADGSWSCELTTGLGDGDATITATVTDPSGNTASDAIDIRIEDDVNLKTPKNLECSVSGTSINLTWDDKAENENGYEIVRRVNGGSWVLLTNSHKEDKESYTDSSLSKGVTYDYRVRAFEGDDYSNSSNTASCTIPAPRVTTATRTAAVTPKPSPQIALIPQVAEAAEDDEEEKVDAVEENPILPTDQVALFNDQSDGDIDAGSVNGVDDERGCGSWPWWVWVLITLVAIFLTFLTRKILLIMIPIIIGVVIWWFFDYCHIYWWVPLILIIFFLLRVLYIFFFSEDEEEYDEGDQTA